MVKKANLLPDEPDTATRSGGSATLQTLSRGLRILRYVAMSNRLLRLRDIAEEFGLERSMALRVLQTLEAEGYLRKHASLKSYSPGPALEEIANPPTLVERLSGRIVPILDELARVTGQTSHMGVLIDDHAVLTRVIMPGGPVAVQQTVGDLENLYCSAIGKAIYAFLPEEDRARIDQNLTFVRHTPTTLPDLAALRAEAETIRSLGVAFDRQEGPAPLACIAAPILDENGVAVASLGVSAIGPLLNKPITEHTRWIEAVTASARRAADFLD